MSTRKGTLLTFTITNGQTTSNEIAASGLYESCDAFLFLPLSVGQNCVLEVSIDGGTNYGVLQSGGGNLALDDAVASPIDFMVWTHMRVVAAAAVSGDQDIQALPVWRNL